MSVRVLLSAASFVLLFSPSPVLAQLTPIANPSGFSGRETVVTFEGASTQPVISSFGGVGLSNPPQSGVSVGQTDMRRPFGPQEVTVVDTRAATGSPMVLTLPGPMTRVAFEVSYNNCGERASLQFFRGSTLVASATSPPSQQAPFSPGSNPCAPAGFVFTGFESTTPFDRVTVIGPGDSFVSVDNIRFENVTPPPVLTALANPSAFSGRETVITFAGLSDPAVASLSGVTFAGGGTPSVALGMDDSPRPFGPQDPMVVDNRPSSSQPISLTFSSPMTRVGFESRFNGCASQLTATFFSGATQIGALTSPPSGTMPGGNCSPGAWLFAGFQSTTPFDRVVLSAPTGGYLRVDNIRFER